VTALRSLTSAKHVDGDRFLYLVEVLTNARSRIRPELKDFIITIWPELLGERHDDEVVVINERARDWWRGGWEVISTAGPSSPCGA
jgi:hypothetical protein